MVKSKPLTIIWDDFALIELQEILEYLSGRSILAPKIVKKAVLANIKLISKSPFIFESDKLKIDKDQNFRAFSVYSYRITYQIVLENNEIRILRIRHTSREPLGY